ncbi:sulfatase family protein [Pelagicoccus mobilis]|uniref:Arylsulfatase n=1 Tax=Pelagicoccus mobilis TaxID=415221 RepID=A0A934RYI2_9BACT|nr:arylsulfatase [Pelagicoccus mobilis]MBK1875868.1 arylsulfatase [Pelagicoccus mobilis]
MNTFKLLFAGALLSASSVFVSAIEKPNIIVIYADDVGYGDLGCYGAEAIDTPNLDSLAKRGIRFTSAYASASTCTPSRYSLLTGEYAFRNKNAKILPGNAPLIIDPDKPTIASVLKENGYRTGLVGKWHLGLGLPTDPVDWNQEIEPGPKQLGFEYSYHMAATGDRVPTVFIEDGRIANLDPKDPVSVSYQTMVGDEPTGISHPHLLKSQADEQHAKTIVDGTSRIGYMTGGQSARWTDEEMPDEFLGKAISFIEENKDEPFFLYYAVHENHVPRIPHPRFRGSSGLGVRGDAVVQMDWGIGRIMETLQELKIAKNTLIIFSSDNGPVLYDGYYDGAVEMNGDHKPAGPWRGGKYSAWEGGTRMPFIVSWPGTIKAGLSDALISQVDLIASLAAIAGAEIPEGKSLDSQNLSSVLLGKSERGRDSLIQQGVNMEAIRKGNWKYVPPGEVRNRRGIGIFESDKISAPGALYYLPEDPMELNNLAWMYPAKVKELRSALEKEVGPVGGKRGKGGLGGAVDK